MSKFAIILFMLSVITYNILHGKNLDAVLQWLLKGTYDLICLQEFPEEKIEEFINKIRKKIPFDYKFAIGFIRSGRRYGELTLFNKDKIKILRVEVIKLGSSIVERRIRRDNSDRSSLATVFMYKEKKFLLINAHLASLSLNGFRMQQVAKILKKISEIIPSESSPAIFLGDFNYSSLTRRRKLIEFMASFGFLNAYKKYTHRLFYLKHQLDYVFYKNCYIDSVEVMKLPFSDHFLVNFLLNFQPKVIKKVAIFDFDGTIANTIPSSKNLATLFNTFAKDLGFTQRVSEKDIEIFRNQNLLDIVKKLNVRFYKLPFIVRKVQKGLQVDIAKANPILQMPEVIKKLKGTGYTLGIVTSSREDFVKNFLKRHGIKEFDFIFSGSSLFGKHRVIQKMLKEYKFEKEEVIYIGDEIRDIQASRKSEIPIISVTWGFNSKKGLQKYLPQFLAEKPEDIIKILT